LQISLNQLLQYLVRLDPLVKNASRNNGDKFGQFLDRELTFENLSALL